MKQRMTSSKANNNEGRRSQTSLGKRVKNRLRDRSGTTLIELMVSMLLMGILMVMIIGVIHPAFRMFVRTQRLQYAEMILDNISEDLQAQVREAVSTVKIYSSADVIAGSNGADSGTVLEYMTTQGYMVLVTADGCDATSLVHGNPDTTLGQEDTNVTVMDAVPSGRIFSRYYWRQGSDGRYQYSYSVDGTPVARALSEAYGSGFYMKNYLKVTFSYPADGIGDNGKVSYVIADLALYSDSDRTEANKITSMQTILDFRYDVAKTDEVTAVAASATEE